MFTSFYVIVLTVHSLWRWVVLGSAFTAVGVGLAGLVRRWAYFPLGRRAGLAFVGAVDAQLFMGLWLYGISPLVRAAWANLPAAMKTHDLRFFSVEHVTAMLAAVTLVHVGAWRCQRVSTDRARYGHLAGWSAAALALILAGLPWWRPFLRAVL